MNCAGPLKFQIVMASFVSFDGTEIYPNSFISDDADQVTVAEIDGALCRFQIKASLLTISAPSNVLF